MASTQYQEVYMAKRKQRASSVKSRRRQQSHTRRPHSEQSIELVDPFPRHLRNGADTLRGPLSALDKGRLEKIRNYEELTKRALDLLLQDRRRRFTATEISHCIGVPRNQVALLLIGYKVDHHYRGRKDFSVYPPPSSQPAVQIIYYPQPRSG
jgi:hypothetical protein